MRSEEPPPTTDISPQEIVLQLQVRRWFRVALWLSPVVGLSVLVGSSALPSSGVEKRGGPLCSTGFSALRMAASSAPLLRKVRVNPGDPVQTVPGMPPVLNPSNLYSGAASDRISPAVGGALSRIYVPNRRSNNVYVIDPATLAVVDRFPTGPNPQHVVPSWDLKTLWVANNAEHRRTSGSLTSIDPNTGKPGNTIPVDDPYNLYFTPDGKSAIVVAERRKRLDFRDPHAAAIDRGPKLLRDQPCRFLDRRALRDLHLRVPRRRAGQDRPRQPQGARLYALRKAGYAAGHPHFSRRQPLLHCRYARRRRLCRRR